ncbi:MAG: diaminopimelate decarboxylase [Dehalococcoidales bacterium]|nr:diaminopimelate decarboxylase [Dehalococcoidales bacterium]
MIADLSLFPLTAEVNSRGHLAIGGCDATELAAEFATPLYVFDELSLRSKCAEFKTEFAKLYPDTMVIYAAKAFINTALARLFNEERVGLDVVSAGELYIAREAGFPLDKVYFHGNNKSAEELKLALEWEVGRVVVDNLYELEMLDRLAGEWGVKPNILLRLSPGVDPHTHKYIATGVIDSKFGFPMTGAGEAVARAASVANLNLIGLHFHIGSLIPEVGPYELAIERVLDLSAGMKKKHGFELKELDIGGGFAVQYTRDAPAPPVATYAQAITARIVSKCRELGLAPPRLIIEPGRAMVGQAGVALYRVGVIKEIPGVRCYVSVDGGMGDNIRPALYGAKYEAVVANKMNEKDAGEVAIAGKFCESGDILVKDVNLPRLTAGDIIAIPVSGAYCLPMASNYNASLRPAVVMVKDGKGRLIQRRETFADLTRCHLT